MEKEYYTVKEFARLLNVCEKTIRDNIKKNRIIGFRIGIGVRSPYRIHHSQLIKITFNQEEEEG